MVENVIVLDELVPHYRTTCRNETGEESDVIFSDALSKGTTVYYLPADIEGESIPSGFLLK